MKKYLECKRILTMYILASDFLKKDDKYVFKARNLCCV